MIRVDPTTTARAVIDLSGLHPVTALHSITKKEKQAVLDQNLVLCRNLRAEHLVKAGIKENRINKIIKEASDLVAQ